MNSQNNVQSLLAEIENLPDNCAFVLIGSKKNPLGLDWQNTPLRKQDLQLAAKTRSLQQIIATKENHTVPFAAWKAIGVLCGPPSGGLLFVDCDGASCARLIEELSGLPLEQAMPKTVMVTSGKPGHYQAIYWVPQHLWGSFSTKRLKTGQVSDNGKSEQLELRWNGCQSVIAGHHPDTGSYKWKPGCSPAECEIAEVPTWSVNLMQETFSMQPSQPNQSRQYQSRSDEVRNSDDLKRALSYLKAIPPIHEYKEWLIIGMALHSVSEDLLYEWDRWSQGSANYEPGACEKHWRSFKQEKGIGIGTLGKLAKQYGWQSSLNQTQLSSELSHFGADKNQLLSGCSNHQEEEHEELEQEVQSLVQLAEEKAPVNSLLSPKLMEPFGRRAKSLNVPIEAFVGTFLPVCASLLKIGIRIEIDPQTKFYPPPILWGGLYGEPGSLKSPILSAVVGSLQTLQEEADQQYKCKCEKYNDELSEWQDCSKEQRDNPPAKPIAREYYLDDTTSEATALSLSKQPNQGILVCVDELSGFFDRFNQYRSGRGDDRQKWLSMYTGGAIKVNRKTSDRISLSSTSVSLTGGIQPGILRKHASKLNDTDGLWSRFYWVRLPITEMPAPGEGQCCNLAEILKNVYSGLEAIPTNIYRLDSQGRDIWRDWHCWTEKQKIEESDPAIRSIYPKARERAARIALIAHCANAVAEDRHPGDTISSEQLKAAISFTKWLIGQTKLIYADWGVTNHPSSPVIVRFIEYFVGKGWIKARRVTNWSSSKNKLSAQASRNLMKQIVDLGYAIDNGETGKGYAIQICRNVENIGNKSPG